MITADLTGAEPCAIMERSTSVERRSNLILLITATTVINLDLTGTAIADYQHFIEYYSLNSGLDPTLVAAVILVESEGDSQALNPVSGAVGLMQIMPSNTGPPFTDRPTMYDLHVPETNISTGCEILAELLAREGTVFKALYYYSGGSYWNSLSDYRKNYYNLILEQMEGFTNGRPEHQHTYLDPELATRDAKTPKLPLAWSRY